mmetsp:Transcript_6943/g.10139  ORF Transcript_6943/g.10139 Transcript_6943/m.10139 type:complete len:650 (-) Transcript_6943:276-2225(-)|eukprot:CAMPEP_0194225852 /NCGR_PEP_ID=MMETSP0156-20130528/40514_1 /TAXON_ID=33649 /ORGANISM="Thalassionema nitzschioides, Strain L26-B" /LENGTH=649 /DNA_ID=CAMNT_0038957973 /DNA_START=31 /DNA_END=1980 /DNA_ORIENTATION=-
MALLLETNLDGDLVVDLDLEGSPNLCRNVLKLAKARYFTSNLVFNVVQPNRFCQMGDPTGTGQGGSCIAGVLDSVDEESSTKRFLKTSSAGREITSSIDLRKRGKVVCIELMGIPDTIGSQFSILLGHDQPGHGMDGFHTAEEGKPKIVSLGQVTEDDNDVLGKLEQAYCDPTGRPFVDIRLRRVLVLHDPFDDPPELEAYLRNLPDFQFDSDGKTVLKSPDVSRPSREKVKERISADQLTLTTGEEDEETRLREQEKEARQQDHSRAVVLELLGDLPDANFKAPENVLFVCKLNRETQEEDLELIFSRFDPNVNVDLIRDYATGDSLQYAFVDFSTKEQCTEAYFKMDNALVDDRRIKVDFSQSVAKLWNRHTQQKRQKKIIGSKESISQSFNKPARDEDRRKNFRHHDHHRGHLPRQRNDERHTEYRNESRRGDTQNIRGDRERDRGPRKDRDGSTRHRYDVAHHRRDDFERDRCNAGRRDNTAKYENTVEAERRSSRRESDDDRSYGRDWKRREKESRRKHHERRYSSDEDDSVDDSYRRSRHHRKDDDRNSKYRDEASSKGDRRNERKHQRHSTHSNRDDRHDKYERKERNVSQEETDDSSDGDFSYNSPDEERRGRKRQKKQRKKRKHRHEKREGKHAKKTRKK